MPPGPHYRRTKTFVRSLLTLCRIIADVLHTVWLSTEITYGLYLSDHTILDAVDTELVVLSGIMIQNLKRETGWHLRGTRRIGVSYDDVETIQQCVSSPYLIVSLARLAPLLTRKPFTDGCCARSRKSRHFAAYNSTRCRE